MFGAIVTILSLVVLTLLSVVALHLGCLALGGAGWIPNLPGGTSIILGVLIAAGALGLWEAIESFFGPAGSAPSLPQSLKVGAVFLYLAGCLIYMELRSLVARGYSLRILVDLLSSGGSASMERLKSGYGDGVGIQGMLAKRLGTLASLRLLRFQGNHVGPLTLLGKIFATASSGMRRLLRLEMVG